jgi:hypothetical protein
MHTLPLYNALQVLVTAPATRKFLLENDPKALEQAEAALTSEERRLLSELAPEDLAAEWVLHVNRTTSHRGFFCRYERGWFHHGFSDGFRDKSRKATVVQAIQGLRKRPNL